MYHWKPGKEMFLADALSHNYIDEEDKDWNSEEFGIEVKAMVKNLPVSSAKCTKFQTLTNKDHEVKKLKESSNQRMAKIPKRLTQYLKTILE